MRSPGALSYFLYGRIGGGVLKRGPGESARPPQAWAGSWTLSSLVLQGTAAQARNWWHPTEAAPKSQTHGKNCEMKMVSHESLYIWCHCYGLALGIKWG